MARRALGLQNEPGVRAGPPAQATVRRLSAVAEAAPVALAAIRGPTHVFSEVNAAFARLAGDAPETLRGRSFASVMAEPPGSALLAALDRVRVSGRPESVVEHEHRRGSERSHWTWHIWPTLDPAGRPEGLSVLAIDASTEVEARGRLTELSERSRQVNEELLLAGLREQELADRSAQQAAQLSALLDGLGEGVLVIDVHAATSRMNAAGHTILGTSVPPGVDGRGGWHLRRKDGSPLSPAEWPIERVLHGDRVAECEFVLVRRDGERRTLLFSGSGVRDVRGAIVLALCIFRDVTDLRQLEQEREEYVGLISHDLRSPLHSVAFSAELLLQSLRAGGRAHEVKAAQRIRENASRMSTMIDELLESTRLEGRAFELRRAPVDLVALLRRVIERLGPVAAGRVELCLAEVQEVPLSADAERLDRALTNLVTNALKYSPEHAPVRVEVASGNGEAVVRVSDRGRGIASDELPRVFDRYYRAGNKETAEGVGLGLYITKLIAEAHGGSVRAESELGAGSTFTFSLPLG
jgi:PAS domain S-box-containing protein